MLPLAGRGSEYVIVGFRLMIGIVYGTILPSEISFVNLGAAIGSVASGLSLQSLDIHVDSLNQSYCSSLVAPLFQRNARPPTRICLCH